MKSYFKEDSNWTPEAIAIDNEITKHLQVIVDREIAKGYNPRELEAILSSASHMAVTHSIVKHRLEKRNQERLKPTRYGKGFADDE